MRLISCCILVDTFLGFRMVSTRSLFLAIVLVNLRAAKNVEFVAIDRDGVMEQMVVEKERQVEALHQLNPVSFVAQSRILLMSLKARLEGPCPTTTAEVVQLHCHVEEDLKKLSKLTFSPGVHGAGCS